jgi:hypothetical protein
VHSVKLNSIFFIFFIVYLFCAVVCIAHIKDFIFQRLADISIKVLIAFIFAIYLLVSSMYFTTYFFVTCKGFAPFVSQRLQLSRQAGYKNIIK